MDDKAALKQAKEEEARKKREAARAYLSNKGQLEEALGQSKVSVLKTIAEKTKDNTLDLLAARKDSGRDREKDLKNSLLVAQSRFTSDWLARKAAMEAQDGEAGAPGGGGPALEIPPIPTLPKHWHDATDPATGATYYWNSQSGESTWEKPVLPPLPPGWIEAFTPERKMYYWHKAANVTTWRRPKAGSVPDAVSELPVLPLAAAAILAATSGDASSLPKCGDCGGWGVGLIPAGETLCAHCKRVKAGVVVAPVVPQRKSFSLRGRGGGPGQRQGNRFNIKPMTTEVDPMDPTGSGGRWSDGLEVGSDKAADSTASGPLWQQRPYPAPGVALKRKPGAMDTNAVKKGRPEDEVIGPSLK